MSKRKTPLRDPREMLHNLAVFVVFVITAVICFIGLSWALDGQTKAHCEQGVQAACETIQGETTVP